MITPDHEESAKYYPANLPLTGRDRISLFWYSFMHAIANLFTAFNQSLQVLYNDYLYRNWHRFTRGVEVIEEVTNLRIEGDLDDLNATFRAKIISDINETYYILYNQTWGLGMVRRGSESGPIIYSPFSHYIHDGEIHEIRD